MTVSDGGTHSCPVTLVGGAGSCQITEKVAGHYSFSASYAGDSNDASSATLAVVAVTVGKDATKTSITNVASPFVVGQPITINVAVGADVPGSGTPSGTVTVSDGTTTCIATLSGGTGGCHITETAVGLYTFTASYGGDTNDFSSASAGFPVTVGGDATTTALTGMTAGPVVGQPITVSVSVVANPPGSGTPAGMVTVSDGGTRSCLVTLVAGVGSCQIIERTAGHYSFSATYARGTRATPPRSPLSSSLTVAPDETTTAITGATPSRGGRPADHGRRQRGGRRSRERHAGWARSPSATAPTCCMAKLKAGAGSCKISATTAGEQDFTASYGGSLNDASSATPAATTVIVGKATTKTALKLSGSRVTYGDEQAERLSVTVSPQFAGVVPSGKVTLKESTTTLCVIKLSSAKGSCTLGATKFGAGVEHLVASYGGSSDFDGSSSSHQTVTISDASTRTASRCPPRR